MNPFATILERILRPSLSISPIFNRTWPCFLTALVCCKAYMFYMQRKKYPPGPRAYPFIGNLPALAIVGGSFYRAAEKWKAVYGDVFTVWIGESPWIFVNSLNTILECNSITTQNLFGGRHRTNTGDVQMQGNTGIIFSDLGLPQQALRSVAQQALRKYLAACGCRVRTIISIVDNFLEERRDEFVESKHIAEEIVQSLTTQTMFGSQLDNESREELRDAHRELEKNCPSGLPSDVMSIFRFIFWFRERAGMAAFERYNKIARDLCHRTAEAYFSAQEPRRIECVMDAVQSAVQEPTGMGRRGRDHLTPGNVLQIVFDLFEAGSQTSVITLNWALLKLASDQDLQEVLHEEAVSTIEALGHFPTRKTRETLPRLQSFIKEVLRYWPAAPFGLPRKLMRTTRIGQYVVPANSTILFNLHGANRDPEYWVQGEVFLPERFLDENGNFDDRAHRGFITFSLGPRSCVGSMLAIENLYFVLARILQLWKIHPRSEGVSLVPHSAALMLDAQFQNIMFELREANDSREPSEDGEEP